MSNTPKRGPRLIFDKHWATMVLADLLDELQGNGRGERVRAGLRRAVDEGNNIVNYIGEIAGSFKKHLPWRLPGFRMPAAGVVKRVFVEIHLRRSDAACGAPLADDVDRHPGLPMRKGRRTESAARSLQERIAAHITPLAQLFEHQKPATFRGWMRACLDHFIRRYREADQEAANADYQPVFLEADRATVAVKRMRPKRGEQSFQTATAETADAVAAVLPPSKQNLSALKDRAQTLLPLLKGNEVTVFECLRSGDVTSQRDIVKATGLTEGAVSKILDRIIKKAG
jgi:hypothetical protein